MLKTTSKKINSEHLVFYQSCKSIDLSGKSLSTILDFILTNSQSNLNSYWLGRIDYSEAWKLQKVIQENVINKKINDVILFLEHDSVYTLGKNADLNNLLPARPKDIDVIQTDRGGEITYHGPGQLVGYPIIDLKKYRRSITWFMRSLEQSIIEMLNEINISSTRKEGLTGVWVNDHKIAALGVRLSKWVSMHGFAINIHTDLSLYRGMIPCGISDFGLTSIAKIKGEDYSLLYIADLMIQNLQKILILDIEKKVEYV
ncbi:MAG: lipoyl(octanoyl) transferase [Candidatus Marinimicrobia bacterium]|nr:lipoyl(octanoyl) transferase [Candidatus Neomarinimicrobiota bacterium]MBV67070.1 lipoyl(octanoyl) transferase [Candidatus Neomarinimicrobiota bacterium]|tara:strand:- start:5534 stop:6307 length:774 start_codon:yes stop_codon:yes gene_type:complete